jgi:hypothetical protein
MIVALLALLCACDEPGGSDTGTTTSCREAMRTWCERHLQFYSGTRIGWEVVPAPESPFIPDTVNECMEVLADGDGLSMRTAVIDAQGEGFNYFGYGCAFDDGRDWRICRDEVSLIDGGQLDFGRPYVCRVYNDPRNEPFE